MILHKNNQTQTQNLIPSKYVHCVLFILHLRYTPARDANAYHMAAALRRHEVLGAAAEVLLQEQLRPPVEVDAVRRPRPAVALVRVEHVLDGDALVRHAERDLVRLGLLDARVVRALADQQRRLDGVDVV